MRSPQLRQCPRRSIHERTGVLPCAAIASPQLGHFERPVTNDSPRGTRYATTVAKLPRIVAARRAMIAGTVSSNLPRLGWRRSATSTAQSPVGLERPPPPPPGSERQLRVSVHIQAGVVCRVVVHELEPDTATGARYGAGALALDGDCEAEPRSFGDLHGAAAR